MWLLADMKNVMADLQVSNSWSFGNQRWLGLSLPMCVDMQLFPVLGSVSRSPVR